MKQNTGVVNNLLDVVFGILATLVAIFVHLGVRPKKGPHPLIVQEICHNFLQGLKVSLVPHIKRLRCIELGIGDKFAQRLVDFVSKLLPLLLRYTDDRQHLYDTRVTPWILYPASMNA